jgi:copper chaperone CopZ
VADGVRQTDLSVPRIHCGGCIRTVEKALGGLAGVESARVNLSTKARDRQVALERRSRHRSSKRSSGRLRGAFVRQSSRMTERRTVGTDTRPRRRGIRRQQHHVAFGLGLVGRRSGDSRPVSLAVAIIALPRWPIPAGYFSVRHGRRCGTPHKHGCTDLAGCAARLRQ